jgi:hypothetical protein
MRKLFLSSFFIIAILLMFSCLGCGLFSGRYGDMVPDTNAAKAFESFQISADFNYYFSGSDVYPGALMGLNKKYTLDSTFWKKIDPSTLRFRELVLQMQWYATHHVVGAFNYGFAILDDKGNQIGIWYSLMENTTTVLMKEDQHVEIYTPDQLSEI